MRHDIFATELGQHPQNATGELRDLLDEFNVYIIIKTTNDDVVGLVSVTPPGHGAFSIDKYLRREELPFDCDDGTYEIRLLAVSPPYRGGLLAWILMYAAYRYVESQGGRRVVAIGRREISDMYVKSGLTLLGRQVTCGRVTFEFLTATIENLRNVARTQSRLIARTLAIVEWRLDFPIESSQLRAI